MSLSTSRTGMKVKTFLKKHGEAGIRLMGKAFVKPARGEDLSNVDPLELGDRDAKQETESNRQETSAASSALGKGLSAGSMRPIAQEMLPDPHVILFVVPEPQKD